MENVYITFAKGIQFYQDITDYAVRMKEFIFGPTIRISSSNVGVRARRSQYILLSTRKIKEK